MRRHDKQHSETGFLELVAREAMYCHIGFNGPDDCYLVPMNFGFADNTFWFHCAHEGTKIDLLLRNNSVSISLVGHYETVSADKACGWGAHFRSVIALGRAEIVRDNEEKIAGLQAIMQKYSGSSDHDFPQQMLDQTTVLKVPVLSFTGKEG